MNWGMNCGANRGFNPQANNAYRGFNPQANNAYRGFNPQANNAYGGFNPLANNACGGFNPLPVTICRPEHPKVMVFGTSQAPGCLTKTEMGTGQTDQGLVYPNPPNMVLGNGQIRECSPVTVLNNCQRPICQPNMALGANNTQRSEGTSRHSLPTSALPEMPPAMQMASGIRSGYQYSQGYTCVGLHQEVWQNSQPAFNPHYAPRMMSPVGQQQAYTHNFSQSEESVQVLNCGFNQQNRPIDAPRPSPVSSVWTPTGYTNSKYENNQIDFVDKTRNSVYEGSLHVSRNSEHNSLFYSTAGPNYSYENKNNFQTLHKENSFRDSVNAREEYSGYLQTECQNAEITNTDLIPKVSSGIDVSDTVQTAIAEIKLEKPIAGQNYAGNTERHVEDIKSLAASLHAENKMEPDKAFLNKCDKESYQRTAGNDNAKGNDIDSCDKKNTTNVGTETPSQFLITLNKVMNAVYGMNTDSCKSEDLSVVLNSPNVARSLMFEESPPKSSTDWFKKLKSQSIDANAMNRKEFDTVSEKMETEDYESDDDPEFVQSQLFIGNLDMNTSQREIETLLKDCNVHKVWIAFDKYDITKICAFVKVSSFKETRKIISQKNKAFLRGHRVTLRFAAAGDFEVYDIRKPTKLSQCKVKLKKPVELGSSTCTSPPVDLSANDTVPTFSTEKVQPPPENTQSLTRNQLLPVDKHGSFLKSSSEPSLQLQPVPLSSQSAGIDNAVQATSGADTTCKVSSAIQYQQSAVLNTTIDLPSKEDVISKLPSDQQNNHSGPMTTNLSTAVAGQDLFETSTKLSTNVAGMGSEVFPAHKNNPPAPSSTPTVPPTIAADIVTDESSAQQLQLLDNAERINLSTADLQQVAKLRCELLSNIKSGTTVSGKELKESVVKDTSSVQQMPSSQKNPGNSTKSTVFNPKSEFQQIVKAFCPGASLLGLKYITEYLGGSGCARYICGLCTSLFKGSDIASHIISLRHRMIFFKEEYPYIYKMLSKRINSLDDVEFWRECDVFAKKCVTENDCISTVQHEHIDRYLNLDLSSLQNAGLEALKMKRTNLVKKIDETMSIGTALESQIDRLLHQAKETNPNNCAIVGLKFITEIIERESGAVSYICSCCRKTICSCDIGMHMLGTSHRIEYFVVERPDIILNKIGSKNVKAGKELPDICLQEAQLVEERDGLCQVLTISRAQQQLLEAKFGILVDLYKEQSKEKEVTSSHSFSTTTVVPVWCGTKKQWAPEVALIPFLENQDVLKAARPMSVDVGRDCVHYYRYILMTDRHADFSAGLRYVTEVQRSGGQELYGYYCKLCMFTSRAPDSIHQHVCGYQHSMKYLKLDHPNTFGKLESEKTVMKNVRELPQMHKSEAINVVIVELMASENNTAGFVTNTSTGESSLLGQPTAQASTGGGLLGQPTAKASTGGGLFGQPTAQASTGRGLFGQPTAQASTGGGLFGQPTAQASTGRGLFGQPTAQASTGGGLFGQPTTQASTGGGLFGQTNKPLFGAATTTTQSRFGFGTNTSTAAGGLFGQAKQNKPLFGMTTTTQPSLFGTGNNIFGQPATTGTGFGTSQAGIPFANKPAFGAHATSTSGFQTFANLNSGANLFAKPLSQPSTGCGFNTAIISSEFGGTLKYKSDWKVTNNLQAQRMISKTSQSKDLVNTAADVCVKKEEQENVEEIKVNGDGARKGIRETFIQMVTDNPCDGSKKNEDTERNRSAGMLDEKSIWKKELEKLEKDFSCKSIVKCERRSKFLEVYMDKADKAVFIGLKEIIEIQQADKNEELRYLCFLCEKKLSWKEIYDHVTSSEHRLQYMKCSYQYLYRLVTSNNPDSMSLEGFAREIASTEGDASDLHVMIEVGHCSDDQDCNNNKKGHNLGSFETVSDSQDNRKRSRSSGCGSPKTKKKVLKVSESQNNQNINSKENIKPENSDSKRLRNEEEKYTAKCDLTFQDNESVQKGKLPCYVNNSSGVHSNTGDPDRHNTRKVELLNSEESDCKPDKDTLSHVENIPTKRKLEKVNSSLKHTEQYTTFSPKKKRIRSKPASDPDFKQEKCTEKEGVNYQGNKSVGERRQGDSLKQLMEQGSHAPVVGLKFVIEIQHLIMKGLPSLYRCTICSVSRSEYLVAKEMLCHLCSRVHQKNFFNKVKHELYKEMKTNAVDLEAFNSLLDQYAKLFQDKTCQRFNTVLVEDTRLWQQPFSVDNIEKESFGALVQLKDVCLHVKICNYVSPSEIHLQLVQTDKTACQELMKKMQMTYRNTKPDNMVKWEVGWFCAAFLMSKNIWYRGKITNATPKKQSFQVFLIDYGSTHMISEHNLRRVYKQFQTIPCLSFCCKLSDLRPGNSHSDPRLGNSNTDPRQGNSSSDPRLGNSNSDPRLGNSNSDPRLGNSHSDPRLGNSHSDPRLGNSHSDPRLGNSNSHPRLRNSNSHPRLGNSNSDPRLGNSHSDPRLGNSHSDPRLGNRCSDPRLGNSNSDPMLGNSCSDSRLGNSNSDPRLGNSNSDPRLENSNSDPRLGNSNSDPRLGNRNPDPKPEKSNSDLMPQNSRIEWPSSTIMIVRNTIQKRNIFLEKKGKVQEGKVPVDLLIESEDKHTQEKKYMSLSLFLQLKGLAVKNESTLKE